MLVVRETTIYPVKLTLIAVDRYNDYSVVFDHSLRVDYGNGREQSFDVGTSPRDAIAKYEAAAELVHSHAAQKAASASAVAL